MLLLSDPVSTVSTERPALATRRFARADQGMLAVLAFVLLAGCFLRLPPYIFIPSRPALHWLAPLHPTPMFEIFGIDEKLYGGYVGILILHGPLTYQTMAQRYVEQQRAMTSAILPPTRFFYIAAAYTWHLLWGTGPLTSLSAISSLFSMLLLILSALFAWRLGGRGMAVGVAALMAFGPTQIHMSQHALIDGVFAFWATVSIWLLWENLRRPNNWPTLVAYGGALAVMVLTKENAMFVFVGILFLLAANHWFRFGQLTRRLGVATILGPLLGVVILVMLCGGLGTMIEIYRLLVSRASITTYAIQTGDGPWYRYLIDLMVVSPLILLLAIGAVFRLRASDRAGLYLFVFVAASFLVMANVRYGMNLRYTNMWDFPLSYLALSCLWQIVPRGRRQVLGVSVCLVLLCTFELRQYQIFFVQHNLYELVPEGLLRAVNILK